MEDTRLYSDEDCSSYDSYFSDSDKIDSETEAQLYSTVHHEENLSSCTSGMESVQTSEGSAITSDKGNDVFSMEEETKNVKTESIGSVMPISRTNIKNSAVKRKLLDETTVLNKLAQKLNPAKKKKSNSNHKVSDVLCSDSLIGTNFNQTPIDESLNNKQKRKTDHGSHKNQRSAMKNEVVINSSDSDIWTKEIDSLAKKDFQTNLCKDEDIINLSSDSEFDILPSPKKRVPDLKNFSMPTVKIDENSKDVWFVRDEDIFCRQRKRKLRRYHDNVEITCTNCKRKGHNSKICPVPRIMKCFICGYDGHAGAHCVNRICSRCYRVGHGSGHCKMPCVNYCELCNMKGHIKVNCPDIWRRYHLTTQPGKIIHAKQVKRHKYLSCSNCGEAGHFGAGCKRFKGPNNCFPTWPCVVSYDDPEDLLRQRLNGCSDRFGSFQKHAYVKREEYVRRNEPCEPGNFAAERKFGRRRERREKKKAKMNLRNCHQIQKAPREKDFPRTPKKDSVPFNFPEDGVPEYVNLLLKQQKRKERNRMRRIKKRQQFLLLKDNILAANNSQQICINKKG